jgi:hypothetical protein
MNCGSTPFFPCQDGETIMHAKFGRQLITLLISTILMLAAFPATSGIFDGLPDVIVCTVEVQTEKLRRGRFVFYLDAQEEGQDTLYKTLGASPLMLRVDQEGKVGSGALPDCSEKSIKELCDAGRAFDLK